MRRQGCRPRNAKTSSDQLEVIAESSEGKLVPTQTIPPGEPRNNGIHTEKPVALPVIPEQIPEALRILPRWVGWKWILKRDEKKGTHKWEKLPINAQTGKAANISDSSTWGDFEAALAAYRRLNLDGISFACAEQDGITGLDLDKCRDPRTGVLELWADKIVKDLDTYTEISPSGRGLRLFVGGKLPVGRRKNGPIEMYDAKRFLTVTGQHLPGSPNTIEQRQEQLEHLHRATFPPPPPEAYRTDNPAPVTPCEMTDEEIVRRASAARNGHTFKALMAGNHGYGSGSEADLALCSLLVFWTQNPAQIDRIYRQSGLYRNKWERPDYRDRTISKALEGRTKVYTPTLRIRDYKAKPSTYGTNHKREQPTEPAPEAEDSGVLEAEDDPHRLARVFLADYEHEDGLRLRFWREEWFVWQRSTYWPLPIGELRARLTRRIKTELDSCNRAALLDWKAAGGKSKPPVARKVTGRLVSDVIQALGSMALVPDSQEMPAWIDGEAPYRAHEILACRNVLLHLPSWAEGKSCQIEPTPRFFSRNALDYNFNPQAGPPQQWLAFLAKLWPKDLESIGTLQEAFGYGLLPDTSQQKIIGIVGPKRGGKGTIARVLKRVIGEANVCAPTLTGLGGPFGLAPLLGKTLGIISDARLSGRTDLAVVVERLLSISGEDAIDIDRKFLPSVTTTLPIRFLLLTNELPRLNDASGALAGRLILIRQTISWYGREDRKLTRKLLTEVEGILLWALEGWKRLQARGHFEQPSSALQMVRDMEDLSSPIGAFIREKCVVEAGAEVAVVDLFHEWRTWCEGKGQKEPGTEQVFGRNLRAALPGIDMAKRRRGGALVRVYVGVRLKRLEEEAAEEEDIEEDAAKKPPGWTPFDEEGEAQ